MATNPDIQWSSAPTSKTRYKHYELPNHLGNVLAVVSDAKIAVEESGSFSHFAPEVLSATDYYPFGLAMEGRTFSGKGYRWGFNGMERDGELADAHSATFFRMYNSKVSKWLSVDPEMSSFPWQSPYVSMDNNPISLSDPFGNSTHTDKEGNVLAVYDDDDLGVYKHDITKEEYDKIIEENSDYVLDGSNAERMGQTLDIFSFVEKGSGVGKPKKEDGRYVAIGTIDFDSYEARDFVNEVADFLASTYATSTYSDDPEWIPMTDEEARQHSEVLYGSNAVPFGKFDFKHRGYSQLAFFYRGATGAKLSKEQKEALRQHRYRGSMLAEGVFVSARDAGNYAAGMAGKFGGGTKLTFMYRAGHLQASQSLAVTAYEYLFGDFSEPIGSHPCFGEQIHSNWFQRLGWVGLENLNLRSSNRQFRFSNPQILSNE